MLGFEVIFKAICKLVVVNVVSILYESVIQEFEVIF